jgi:hypothetical protein
MFGEPLDLYTSLDRGCLVVKKMDPGHWLITWLPHDESDANYPGFTLDSDRLPSDVLEDGEEGILGWVLGQEWAASSKDDEARRP